MSCGHEAVILLKMVDVPGPPLISLLLLLSVSALPAAAYTLTPGRLPQGQHKVLQLGEPETHSHLNSDYTSLSFIQCDLNPFYLGQ